MYKSSKSPKHGISPERSPEAEGAEDQVKKLTTIVVHVRLIESGRSVRFTATAPGCLGPFEAMELRD